MADRKVAIFDVDGTIFRSSLLIQLVDTLIKNGAFPEDARKVFEREHRKWLDREGDYEEYIMAVVKAFRKHIKGVHYSELADAAEELVEEQWKRTYRFARDLIKDLKSKDYYLLAVSHSPKTVLIYSKAAIVRRAVEKEGLTLLHSVGVGDTESDIPFLEMVSKPICFNPNAKLYKYAKRMGWEVAVERKDVIYRL
jgi:phosphoserine phosphatase